MLINCKNCDKSQAHPGARLFLVMLPSTAASAIVCALLDEWAHNNLFHSRSDAIGGEALIFAFPLFVIFGLLFEQFHRIRMKWRYRHSACPHCGGTNWAWPRYCGSDLL
jgi:hypothetical protein